MAEIIVDLQSYFIFILLCIFSLFCYYLFFRKAKDSRAGFVLPPSPPSLPIIGHLHLLLSVLAHKSLQKISTKYGPLLHLHIFTVPILLVSSASVAYEINKTQAQPLGPHFQFACGPIIDRAGPDKKHDLNVSNRDVSANGDSLIFGSFGFVTAAYGDYYKFMKKLLVTKLLGAQEIQRSRSVRAKELERFYFKLHDKARKKESVEIGTEVLKLTSNMICRMSLGRSCSEENGVAERVMELVIKSFSLTKKMFFASIFRRKLEKLGISLFGKEIMAVSDEFGDQLERVFLEHEEKLEENQDPDMVDLLLEAYRDEKAEYKISRKQIKALFVDIFLGGTDTSAQTTHWIMAEIINNPEILNNLREEIDSVVGKARLIQETDLPNLPYLQAVVKEGLRLHPPGPFFVRTFQESCEVGGFYVAEKTTLVVNVYALMRDSEYWEDPDEFKPKRFLASSRTTQEEERREEALKYLPFGCGRRGCPGSNLGYIFIGTAIGVMVQCFHWRTNGDNNKVSMEEAVTRLSVTMAHPLNCTPVSRLDPFSL